MVLSKCNFLLGEQGEYVLTEYAKKTLHEECGRLYETIEKLKVVEKN